MTDIRIRSDGYWIRLGDPKQSSSFTGDLGGKYLFFSESQQTLLDVAKTEIIKHGFEVAKVSCDALSGDFVLCVYWHDDTRKKELFERHRERDDIKYRWWKSNADTWAGKYSNKFKRSAPELMARHPNYTDHEDYDSEFGMFNDPYDSPIFY